MLHFGFSCKDRYLLSIEAEFSLVKKKTKQVIYQVDQKLVADFGRLLGFTSWQFLLMIGGQKVLVANSWFWEVFQSSSSVIFFSD